MNAIPRFWEMCKSQMWKMCKSENPKCALYANLKWSRSNSRQSLIQKLDITWLGETHIALSGNGCISIKKRIKDCNQAVKDINFIFFILYHNHTVDHRHFCNAVAVGRPLGTEAKTNCANILSILHLTTRIVIRAITKLSSYWPFFKHHKFQLASVQLCIFTRTVIRLLKGLTMINLL